LVVKADMPSKKESVTTFKAPEPKRFTVAPGQLGNIAGAALPFAMRLGTGAIAHGYGFSMGKNDEEKYSVFRTGDQMVVESSKISELARPAEPLVLYEFEGCPFCKKVREAVCILDIDVLFKPCPMDGPTFRPEAVAEGGKKMFPYMKDPNTGTNMYESDEIIAYMFNTYGDGNVPLMLRMGPITAITAGLGLLGRLGKGSKYRAAKMPAEPVELWAYDISPFCKVVREVLCELEIPHVFHSCARGSPKRQELFAMTGTFQAPYLEDPNTGVKMFESAEIIAYLESTYAL
jgi:glutathione S-transferase